MVTTTHQNLTIKGERVFWHDQQVEHITSWAQDDYDWGELAERCIHLESLGVTPRSSTVIWHWSWFADMPYDSSYRPLLEHAPGFYQHGCTQLTAQALRACEVSPPAVVEPDGSIAIVHRGVAVVWDGCVARPLEYSRDIADARGIFHAMQAARYNSAQMGQQLFNGPCYAEYEQVEAWLDDHEVSIGGMVSILRALGLDS